jgi:hypothetical protein
LPEEYESVARETSLIYNRTKVQHSLQLTKSLLHPTKKAEFNQISTRLKSLIYFIYNDIRLKPKVLNALTVKRCERLRRLDCDSLKLVALSYTAAHLFDLEDVEFGYLMELVPDFIHRHGIAKLLYRKDISKAAIAPINL